MARSRFRSQPTLRRSGERASTTLLGFCLVVVTAAGAGALVSMAIRGVDDWANAPPARIERLARGAPAAPSPPPIQAAPTAPQVAEAVGPAPELTQKPTKVRSGTPRTSKSPQPLKPLLAELGGPQERWERQQQAYEVARVAYDANERAEGFRWAQRNKVRTRRYCQALEQQRTSAFMQGCLAYAAGAKSYEAAGTTEGDPG